MDGANLTWIGIDVAKATLDLHFLPSGQAHSLANSPAGHRQLLKLLPKPAACRIVLEATGGYEREVVADLLDTAGSSAAPPGAALPRSVRAGLDARLDAARLPAYLEANHPRNRDLYQRHGYQVRSVIELPDGPPLWTMWRTPMG